MKRGLQGHYTTISTIGENVQAFVPVPLPPKPSLEWTPDLRNKFDQALLTIGRLDSVSSLLPETSLFIYMYVRKEAVLSSMIEGTQSSLSDLLMFEMDQEPGVPVDDVREVSNYVAALEYGLNRLRDGFPLSLRLIKEIHNILLHKGRGSEQAPGEFRRSQNWIGGSRPGNAVFVPPPFEKVTECMGQLELFLQDHDEQTPVLQKAALSHVQFETIHPFLDGNGRLGRLLITLILCDQKALQEPMLYLSLYFKMHRQYYYELLNRVRLAGEWEVWLDFFADAVITTGNHALQTSQQLLDLSIQDGEKISGLGRSSVSALNLHRAFLEKPIATSGWLAKKTGITPATVNKALENLAGLGIIKEITDQKRNRVFSYHNYIELMSKGTEQPDS